MQKRVLFILFFIFLAGFTVQKLLAATFFGKIQTGIIEIKDFHYPVYMYVPETVKPESKYPLIISIPDQGEDPDKNVEKWASLAKRKSMIVLVPTFKRLEDMPDNFDRWFFQVKNLMSFAYPVNREKIYLVGEDTGAGYAAYLAMNFPEEFSAVALFGGSWIGPLEKLIRPESRPSKQIPFYVALKDSQADLIEQTRQRALEYEKRGYMVELKTFPAAQDFSDRNFKDQLVTWLSEKSENWQRIVVENDKTWQERTRKAIKRFFTV